jgi:glycosyltransferase involved in cell wall biosynthesis
MIMTSISIVTPSYNQGIFIERTIQSVITQDFPITEYIVFDGGSTDETLDILKRYTHVVCWTSEKDKGQAHAVNKALQASSGEIIGWLNSDDIYYPGAIKTVHDFFARHPEVDVVYGDANHIDKNDQIIETYPTEDWNWDRLLYTCYLCQPAVFFRKRVIEKFGLLDERLNYCMDYEYWLRLAKEGAKFAHLSRVLAGSRLYAETKTLGSRVKVHKEINDMMQRLLGKVPERWIGNYAHVVMEKKNKRGLVVGMGVVFLYFYSALRWNKIISPIMFKNAFKWLSVYFREQLARRKIT